MTCTREEEDRITYRHVSLLASMLEILVLALEILHEEYSQLGLKINWSKTKLQVFDDNKSHPRCLYLDMMLRLSIPLSTLVPALIQLAAVSTTPVGGSIITYVHESIRPQHLAILYQFADQGPTLRCLHTPDSLICRRHVEYDSGH